MLDEVIISKPNESIGYFLKEKKEWTLREIINRMK